MRRAGFLVGSGSQWDTVRRERDVHGHAAHGVACGGRVDRDCGASAGASARHDKNRDGDAHDGSGHETYVIPDLAIRPDRQFVPARIGEVKSPATWKAEDRLDDLALR